MCQVKQDRTKKKPLEKHSALSGVDQPVKSVKLVTSRVHIYRRYVQDSLVRFISK